jgi:hypothetical protein
VFGQLKHAKKTASDLFWPKGGDRNAQIWVGGRTFPCLVLNKVQSNDMDTTRTVFDRTVRAACGFESEHVREDAVDFSTARMHVRDMRVSTADREMSAAAFRPQKPVADGFCACFS